MSVLPWIATGILGWGIVRWITPFLLKHCGAICRGRPRDLHHAEGPAISRLGGLSLVAAYIGVQCVVGLVFRYENSLGQWLIILAPLAMFGLGFWDDLQPLGAQTKLGVQILIALAVVQAGIVVETPQFSLASGLIGPEICKTVLTVAWLVGFTNLINLVDGVDGLALSLGAILMAALAELTWATGPLSWLLTGALAAVVALLRYNTHPARLYLGDGGAYLLGFELGLFSLLAYRTRTESAALIVPLCGLALPILDTMLAIARRGLKGLPIFRPDRQHLHHYLLEEGLSSRQVVSCYCLITLLFVLAGAVFVFWSMTCSVLMALAASALVLLLCRRKVRGYFGWRKLQAKLSFWPTVRRQIAYALCLRKWLRQEAERCSSVEELFGDLKLAARRLGFTSVRLRLADGDRVWKEPGACGRLTTISYLLEGGHLGELELAAPTSGLGLNPVKGTAMKNCRGQCRALSKDPRVMGLLAELLAESWIEATRAWCLGRARLRFDYPLPQMWAVPRRVADRCSPYGVITHTAVQIPGFHQLSMTASSSRGILKRACWLALGIILLNNICGLGDELATKVEATLTRVPRLELPAKAASLVKAARSPDRQRLVTAEAIKTTARISSAVIPAVVGSISKSVPEMAAFAATEATREAPKQAGTIAKAAAVAAPQQTKAIVLSVCRVAPGEYKDISLGVAQVVPDSSREILEALALLFPELLGSIAPSIASATPNPSVEAVLKSTPPLNIERVPGRTGPSPVNGSPLGRGPTVGPPFVPLSGTVTNVTPSTSGIVPTGGRNYATP